MRKSAGRYEEKERPRPELAEQSLYAGINVTTDDFVKSQQGHHGTPHFDFNRGLFDRNHPFCVTGFDFLHGHHCGPMG